MAIIGYPTLNELSDVICRSLSETCKSPFSRICGENEHFWLKEVFTNHFAYFQLIFCAKNFNQVIPFGKLSFRNIHKHILCLQNFINILLAKFL